MSKQEILSKLANNEDLTEEESNLWLRSLKKFIESLLR